jgi:carbamoyl-phosphate synthase large subunit
MKTILVSGASGIVGYGVLRSLRRSGLSLRLLGTTIYEDTPAEAFSDIFEKAIPTSDEGYIRWLRSIIEKYQVQLIIPGIEADMYKWKDHAVEIEKSGARILLNNPELVDLCRDKWLFYESLKKTSFAFVIDSTLENDFAILKKQFGVPFLLKPRKGYASKGIVSVLNEESFRPYANQIGQIMMAQSVVGTENEEYTTAAFCDGKGGAFNRITLKRKLSKEGFTEIAEVVTQDKLDETLQLLCAYFKPLGPTNFQFRKHRGEYKLLEINPRISSSTSIRAAFGFNESAMAVEYFLSGKIPDQPVILTGKAIRYTEDYILNE